MSYEELYKKISPTLKRITWSLSRKFYSFSGEDLFQEAALRLLLEHRSGKLDDKTDSYILQGCYFHLRNYIRKNSINARVVSIQSALDKESDNMNLEEILNVKDPKCVFDTIHGDMLLDAINNNGLTLREKMIFGFLMEGLTTREVGSRVGISHVAVIKARRIIAGKCSKHMDRAADGKLA